MPLALYQEFKEKRLLLEGLKNRINANPGVLQTPTDDSQEATPAVKSVLIKRQWQSDRAAYLQSNQEADATDKVIFEGGTKENLAEITSFLTPFLTQKIKEGNFSSEKEAALTSELQKICVQISPERGAVEVSKVESAYKLFNELIVNYPELDEYSDKFTTVMDELRKTPRLGN